MPSNPEDSIMLDCNATNGWITYTTTTDNTTIRINENATLVYYCGSCGKSYSSWEMHVCDNRFRSYTKTTYVFDSEWMTDWMRKEGESVKNVYEVMVVSTVKNGDDVDLDKIIVQPKLVIAKDQEEAVQKVLVGEAAVLTGVDFKVLARQFRGN